MGAFKDVAQVLDAFWRDAFRANGTPYDEPGMDSLDLVRSTGCGVVGPEASAIYCTLDRTIYLSTQFLDEQSRSFGDFAPIFVLAHEWGHHIQTLLQIERPGDNSFELQADCLAGVFIKDAENQGILEPGDLVEALAMSESVGDPPWLPQDQPGAHGTYADRRNAVMRGFLDGIVGCKLDGFTPPPVTPTPTQLSTTPTPTPTPAPTSDMGDELLQRLPAVLPLSHASCFGIRSDGTETFSQLLGRFGGTLDASNRLQALGWQGSAFRQFGCDGPPEGEAGWIDISVHVFADAASAQQAVDYFTAVRLDGSRHVAAAPPRVGDYSTAMSGPDINGTDVTVYASQGPVLIRVTGVSPSGIPFMNVLTVAQTVLAGFPAMEQAGHQAPSTQQPFLPASAYLPNTPAVRHSGCFSLQDRGSYAYAHVASLLSTTGLSSSELAALGWHDGAFVVFTCAEPPAGRAARIDVGVHQFQDEASAHEALPYFSRMFDLEPPQHRDCDVASNVIVCVSGQSLTGSPLSDVAFVLQQVTANVR